MDLYEHLRDLALREPSRWPAIANLVESTYSVMAPPGSWKILNDEVREVVVDLGVPDDDALDTVFAVQHASQPAHYRSFPLRLELPHDFVAWHDAMIEAKFSGQTWPDVVPRLRSMPPGVFEVDDPGGVCQNRFGGMLDSAWFDGWELESAVARPMPFSIDVGAR
jgi:hypothetical protein